MAAEQLGQTRPSESLVRGDSGTQPSIQEHFLRRLEELLAKRDELLSQGSSAPVQRKVLDKAIYATFTDCVKVGAGEQAQSLLDAHRTHA